MPKWVDEIAVLTSELERVIGEPDVLTARRPTAEEAAKVQLCAVEAVLEDTQEATFCVSVAQVVDALARVGDGEGLDAAWDALRASGALVL